MGAAGGAGVVGQGRKLMGVEGDDVAWVRERVELLRGCAERVADSYPDDPAFSRGAAWAYGRVLEEIDARFRGHVVRVRVWDTVPRTWRAECSCSWVAEYGHTKRARAEVDGAEHAPVRGLLAPWERGWVSGI